MGEKSHGFGGAIRDMWNPTCYGDPGKVTDAEYKCDPTGRRRRRAQQLGCAQPRLRAARRRWRRSTAGRDGLGLDKAAAIWWRAQTAYLTPQSNFIDARRRVRATSCADLVGQPINKLIDRARRHAGRGDADHRGRLRVGRKPPRPRPRLRTEPVKCNFKPLLAKDAPATCGEGFTEDVLWSEDFEDGLAGWSSQQRGRLRRWHPRAVAGRRLGPDRHRLTPREQGGVRSGDPTRAAASATRAAATSPAVTRSSARSCSCPTACGRPKLTFEHYVATEIGYDGGNVKMSINGGAFTAIPAAAYLYNEPTTLTRPATNTNPLAGQPGFTGTDGGQTKGSWGESQVDIAAAGAKPATRVQLRFDIGRDGCGGNEGWYVDNVQIVDCKLVTETTAVHRPEPSTFGTASTAEVTVERDGSVGGAAGGHRDGERRQGHGAGLGHPRAAARPRSRCRPTCRSVPTS